MLQSSIEKELRAAAATNGCPAMIDMMSRAADAIAELNERLASRTSATLDPFRFEKAAITFANVIDPCFIENTCKDNPELLAEAVTRGRRVFFEK